MKVFAALFVALLVIGVNADLYMHAPPGSNDRNRERNDNRNNGDRLFDSQNNGKGGYPWRGNARLRATPDPLTYYTGSVLRVEWTNQHSCGGNPNVVCDMIVQLGCDTVADNLQNTNKNAARAFPGLRDGYPDSATETASDNANTGYLRRQFSGEAGQNQDGTNTIPENQFSTDPVKRDEFYIQGLRGGVEFGMHENFDMYATCKTTERNKGLYTADQKLNTNDARATRQNPNGARRGLECPEERDYYPYWNNKINKWRDVAILTNNLEKCDYFRENSPNVVAYGYCNITTTNGANVPNNPGGCTGSGGKWVTGTPNGGPKPDCLLHPFTRDNHLGNVAPINPDGSFKTEDFQPETAYYLMTIPGDLQDQRCVVRLRYNMSTLDYNSDAYAFKNANPYTVGIDASKNCPRVSSVDNGNVDSDTQTIADNAQCTNLLTAATRPLFNRPYVDVFGGGAAKLSIALNTNQAGRTFQDRSYVFDIRGAPVSGKIWNLGVRGRRGNIVQAYPAVEYDFTPSVLRVTAGDFVHVQLHGSDFNEAKNANNGEGWQYSDRFNLVQYEVRTHNFPIAKTKIGLFSTDAAKYWALLEQENCKDYKNGDTNEQNAIDNCGKLNRAPNRFPQDPTKGLLQAGSDIGTSAGTYHYGSTRNNNFSNRSQKASLVVDPSGGLTSAQIAGITVGVIAAVGLGIAGVCFYAKKRPNSPVGECCGSCMSKCKRGPTSTTSPPDMEYQRR